MKAFILAAGLGTRLHPLTNHIPKPLIPVLNIPALFYTIVQLKQAGISEIVCNIHHHAGMVRDVMASHVFPGMHIIFSEEPVILGTGGGLKKCEKLLGDNDFILVNSDIIADIDFRALMLHHQQSGFPGTLTLFETPAAQTIGFVGVENALVKDFRNQRHTGLVSSLIYTGTSVLSPQIFRFLKTEYSSIVDTGFTGLIDNGGLGFYQHKGLWMDIGTMQSYWQANLDTEALLRKLSTRMSFATEMLPHAISPDAFISPEARVSGSVIGKDCHIGAHCSISNSVLLPGVKVKPGSSIINAVVDPYSITIIEEPKQERGYL